MKIEDFRPIRSQDSAPIKFDWLLMQESDWIIWTNQKITLMIFWLVKNGKDWNPAIPLVKRIFLVPDHIWPKTIKGQPALTHVIRNYVLLLVVPLWDDIFTPTISSPRGENIVTIFSPPLRYFHPLTISNGKSFCSQISLNFIMCIKNYNKEPFFYTFYDFLQIFVHHRLLIQSINISTKTLSFNSKEGIMLKYNHFNPPSFMGWIYGYE